MKALYIAKIFKLLPKNVLRIVIEYVDDSVIQLNKYISLQKRVINEDIYNCIIPSIMRK